MITRFLKKYLSIVFILALFVGSFHHHDDTIAHDDCQICTIHSNLLNADLPTEVHYLTQIEIRPEAIQTNLLNLHLDTTTKLLHARAPPSFS